MTLDDPHNFQPAPSFGDSLKQKAPEWLQKIGNRLDLGVLIFDEKYNIYFSNKTFLNHCHIDRAFVEGSRRFDDWLTMMAKRGDLGLESPAIGLRNILQAIASDKADSFELHNITPPNGLHLEFRTLASAGGFTTLFSEDVTDLKRHQEALDMALKLGKSGYFYHTFESSETIVSSQYLEHVLTQKENELVKEKGFWPLVHPEESEEIKALWRDTVIHGLALQKTIRINTQNHGVRHFEFSVRPMKSGTGKLIRLIGYFEDVTDQKNAQNKLELEQQRTEEALQSKTRFLARISHEIRTPMNAVIGIADALLHHNYSPEIAPKLELIQSSAGNILNILDDTLNHSKLDSEEFELDPSKENPGKTIQQICDLWTSKAEANKTRIKCHVDESVPLEIYFDKYRYEQCLNNLLSNAIKFSPGGSIDVIATRVDRNGTPNLLVAVKDTGIGMTDEQKSRIFQPFKQGDTSISKRFGGTGLGMNITKNLIERMGGKITVKSEIGQGSIFAISIPIVQEKEMRKHVSAEIFDDIMSSSNIEKETPYSRLKVLVADDNPTNHMVIRSLLENVVAEVYTADHGRDVLDILDVQDIDIILMDIHMPVMDGIEATLAIRSSPREWSDVMIIAVTADPQYQQQRLCLNIGMDFAVAKPVKLVDLLEAIDQVMAIKNGQLSLSAAV